MNQKVVSVIIRTKDRPFHLLRAISSVARQSYRELEAVIVNDGGCEVDLNKIRKISRGLPVNYIRHTICKGRAEAANTGINNAQGEYIIFLDDDDYLYSHCVKTLVTGINRGDYDMCYGKSDCYEYKNGQKIFLFNLGRPMDIR
ncbi:MAG: glycosyltransferase family 2 protein, partial [Nitrospirae bacterium]